MRTLAEEWLDWKKLGPIVARYRSSIEKEVEADTRKLDSFDEFLRLTADAPEAGESRGRRGQSGLRAFADGRRSFLLAHPEIQKAAAASPSGESAAP